MKNWRRDSYCVPGIPVSCEVILIFSLTVDVMVHTKKLECLAFNLVLALGWKSAVNSVMF